MDFSRRSRVTIEKTASPGLNIDRLIPHNVLMYIIPPTNEITINEFEELAIERLKLLRVLEQTTAKYPRVLSNEWKEHVITELNTLGLKHYVRLMSGNCKKEADMIARKRDYISHFILRFAYCRSEEMRRWFITREMELFKLKFAGLTQQDIKELLEVYQIDYKPLSAEQKDDIKTGLYASTAGKSVARIETSDFYKVAFTEVLDLIRSRRCFVKNGFAYVSTTDFISVIGAKHQKFIEDSLEAHLRLLPQIENDERLFTIIRSLHSTYTGKDYTIAKNAEVPIESLDKLSKKSYPLCMRYTHDIIRAKHHLKHFGRMQYGLFLKAIGVTLEDSLKFWREEFTRVIDPEKFDKQYAYNIRHNYGKEGSNTNYTPYSCMKIIQTSVGPQDTHGCPFKILDQSNLKLKLISYGLGQVQVQDILNYVSKGHYQIACGKYFEILHETPLHEGINHPNAYFEISQTLMGNRVPKQQQQQQKSMRNNNNDSIVLKKKADAQINDDHELWQLTQNEKELIDNYYKDKKLKEEKSDEKVPLKKTRSNLFDPEKEEGDNWDNDDFDLTLVEEIE